MPTFKTEHITGADRACRPALHRPVLHMHVAHAYARPVQSGLLHPSSNRQQNARHNSRIRRAGGGEIKAASSLLEGAEADVIYDGSRGRGWVWDIAVSPVTKQPMVAFVVRSRCTITIAALSRGGATKSVMRQTPLSPPAAIVRAPDPAPTCPGSAEC